jgi:AcrR family transcriptional regulator
MGTTGRAPSEGMALDGGLRSARNGLGPDRVIEIQRARILAAMVEVSAERGAANVTVAHVVEHAGVSRRTFYEIFDDREDCFVAAFDDAIARASRYVLACYDADAGWAEQIRAALIALLDFLEVERGAGLLLIVGSLGAGPPALERRKRVLAQITGVVDEGRMEAKAGHELPCLTAEGIVGGVLSVLHARLVDSDGESLLVLAGPLISMIVLPYLGMAAARRELKRPVPKRQAPSPRLNGNPLRELQMRLTYRTVRVLMAVAAQPGGSNRQVADVAGITDQGQISKLLGRLHNLGLIENTGAGSKRGAPNAWTLTAKGWEIETTIAS